MQRPQQAKGGPGQIKVQRRPSQLRGDDKSHREAGDAPNHRRDRREFDRSEVVIGPSVDFLGRKLGWPIVIDFEPMDEVLMVRLSFWAYRFQEITCVPWAF